jgi:hypothetical protein
MGALYVQLSPIWGEIRKLGCRRKVILNPLGIGAERAGVDHDKKVIASAAKDRKIIQNAAVVAQQITIPALADLNGADALGEQVLEVFFGIVAAKFELSHVTSVEHRYMGPGIQVFGQDAGILNGHVPTSKRGHAGAQSNVLAVQRGPHGRRVSQISWRRKAIPPVDCPPVTGWTPLIETMGLKPMARMRMIGQA